MKFGVSAFAWVRSIRSVDPAVFEFVRMAGFEGLELPMFDPGDLPVAELRRAFQANSLECTICCILPDYINPISPEISARKRAQAHLAHCIETAAELGSHLVGGPMIAPIGYLPGHRATPDEWHWAVESFQSLGGLLDDTGITLSLEPVNRSETFFLTTANRAAALVDAIGHPRFGVTLDTFHANIEEKSVPAAIDALGSRLRHVHASENDRGLLGSGQVDFHKLISALVRNGYSGYLMIEGFGYSPLEPSAPGYLWADQDVAPEDIARQGLAYLKALPGV